MKNGRPWQTIFELFWGRAHNNFLTILLLETPGRKGLRKTAVCVQQKRSAGVQRTFFCTYGLNLRAMPQAQARSGFWGRRHITQVGPELQQFAVAAVVGLA